MIVVPTEKQFDWRHAPIVLFVIVLLNVLVYFVYQTGDSEKYVTSIGSYLDAGYLEKEWPIFQNYLREQGENETLSALIQQYDTGDETLVAMQILRRQDFFSYLRARADSNFQQPFLSEWENSRPTIQTAFNSVSTIAHGLTASDFKLSALLTYQFLHGGVMHLLGNMFFLVFCGFAVEAAIGHWRFLLFYLLSGFAAGMAQVMADWQSAVPLVGASGAISGVMAMYLMIFRLKKIEFFYWIFFFVGYFRAPALVILPFYIGKEIYSFYSATDSNVAFLAHTGGFVAGAVLMGLSLLVDKKTINQEYIEQDQSAVEDERQALADIYRALERYRFAQAYTLVNDTIKTYGETFELAMIRYNLLKITKGKGFAQSILRLWQMQHLEPVELERLESIWEAYPQLHEKISDECAINLGLQFATMPNSKAVEQLFHILSKRGSRHPDFLLFAQKLSNQFAQQGQRKKQANVDKVIQQFASEGRHGAL